MPIVSLKDFTEVEVDYLVVGGGTSGLVTAVRLSEEPNIVVGVIEAGDHHVGIPEIDVPGMMGRLIANPKYDWTFLSIPQTRANDRVVLQPRGKGLGGSSFLNFMGMFRPSKEEYDALEELGNPGWNWDEMLKYMKKGERAVLPKLTTEEAKQYAAAPDIEYHGTEGPLAKSFPLHWGEVNIPFIDTLEAMGIPRNPENATGSTVGSITSWTSVDPETATRTHAANTYLEPNVTRPNLLVLTGAQVTKVVLETHQSGLLRATGVEFVLNSKKEVYTKVKRDVIISCGTFQSPQILELSGIGNPNILKKFNIETKVDLPGVGENLQDHIMVPTIVEINEKFESLEVLADPIYQEKHKVLYETQQGLMSSVPAQIFAFLPSKAFGNTADVSRWQEKADTYAVVDSNALVEPTLRQGLQKQYELQKRWFADPKQAQAEMLMLGGHFFLPTLPPVPGKRYTSVLCALMHPLSRGYVHITSSDPLAPPAINPNYFGNPTDLDLLTHLVRFGLKTYTTQPFKDMVVSNVLPDSGVANKPADAGEEGLKGLEEFVKDWCGPVYHPVGTAAMLPRDHGGVVDSKLKVYGTINLRVVDLSILPIELSCHTQSAAYAVGEKAADILKAESHA